MSSLFQDLINDMNHYKSISENLKRELEKYTCEIACLKKENKTLEESSNNLESILYTCLTLLKKVDFSKSGLEKDYSALLENEWIKNHANNKSENKLEGYESCEISKLTAKSDLINCQDISNERLSHTCSAENEANEISAQNFKSCSRNLRDIKEDLVLNQGARSLNDNFFNIETLKSKNWQSLVVDNTGHNVSYPREELMSSFIVEEEEDDIICESPKLPEPKMSRKKENQTVEPEILVHESNSVVCQKDLDETYINTAIIHYDGAQAQGTSKTRERNNQKESNREKSPEYDSVPFYYKRDTLRKKSDRLKLPGHTCPDCNQYYKNALGGNLTAKKFRDILNKCSRHRFKNSQSIDNTPPGYWKPYLTASVISPNEEDTVGKRQN